MRVLLQDTETRLYFIDTNQWTEDPLKARDFEDVDRAADAYDAQDLAYARIVVEPGRPAWPQPSMSDLVTRLQAQG